MWTAEFDRFVDPARMRPQLWRLALGLLLVGVVYGATIMLIFAAVAMLAGPEDVPLWMQRIASGTTPTAVLVMLASFAGMFVGPLLAVRWLHRRRARTLFGQATLAHFALAGAIALAVFAATSLLPVPFEPVRNTPLEIFLTFLPLALLAIALQTGAEELLFRGYLQQQLAARFRHPLIWMVVPSLLFGVLHFDPATAGANAPWIVAVATVFGLVAADLTRVTGGIGAAWGLHFVNNAVALLVLALDGSLSGLSLWKTPFGADDMTVLRPLMVQDLVITVIVWACIRLWLARRRQNALTGT